MAIGVRRASAPSCLRKQGFNVGTSREQPLPDHLMDQQGGARQEEETGLMILLTLDELTDFVEVAQSMG